MSTLRFFVKKLTLTAIVPKRGSAQAAGYDLYADQSGTVTGGSYNNEVLDVQADDGVCSILNQQKCCTGKLLVSTGIAVKIPSGYYGRVASRSGLAVKSDIEVGAGVIDSDYRGEVKVLLRNLGSTPFEFKSGDRIAQLIIEKIETPDVEEVSDLDVTDRGDGGFGSTGVSQVDTIKNESTKEMKMGELEFKDFCEHYAMRLKDKTTSLDPPNFKCVSKEQNQILQSLYEKITSGERSKSEIEIINEESDKSLAGLKPGFLLNLRMQAKSKSSVSDINSS